MKRRSFLIFSLIAVSAFLFTSCVAIRPFFAPARSTATLPTVPPTKSVRTYDRMPDFPSDRGAEVLGARLAAAPSPGAKVLVSAMDRLARKTVLRGACWDFVNAIWIDAGFPAEKRKRIFTAPMAGPWADPAIIEPGDWIYYTHQYSASLDHSCVFVSWIDFAGHTALVIDYPGGNRAEPGRWRVADIYKVWGVTRAVE